MATVRKPIFKVIYETTDITEDISSDIVSIRYTDETDGTANEIAITVDDMDHKWKNEWIVNVGARISLQIGYDSDDMLDCGDFGVDEVHYKGQPDTVELKCLSVGQEHDIWVERSHVYESQTILQIIEQIASRNGLDVTRDSFIFSVIEDESVLSTLEDSAYERKVLNILINRIVQDRESDLAFMKRLTSLYGVSFMFGKNKFNPNNEIIGKYLHIWVNMFLSTPETVLKVAYPEFLGQTRDDIVDQETYDEIELKSYDLKNKAQNNVDSITMNYQDPYSLELYEIAVGFEDLPPAARVAPLEHEAEAFPRLGAEWARVENRGQAEVIAAAKLYDIISSQVEGRIDTEGSPLLIAGNSFSVSGIGKLSGKYSITKSSHTIKRNSGWTVSLDVKMVGT